MNDNFLLFILKLLLFYLSYLHLQPTETDLCIPYEGGVRDSIFYMRIPFDSIACIEDGSISLFLCSVIFGKDQMTTYVGVCHPGKFT